MGRHETFGAVVTYVGVWLLVFFEVITLNSSFEVKVIIESVSSLGFAVVGIAYFYTDYKKYHQRTLRRQPRTPILSPLRTEAIEETHLQSKRFFWLVIFMALYQVIFGFLLAIFSWKAFLINGIEVVTYDNLVSMFYGFVSIILTIWVVNRIRNRAKHIESS